MAMKMENVTEGKLGRTNYKMVEAKFNGTIVWPTAVVYTYVVSNVQIHYSKYPTEQYIGASGDRYSDDFAYWTGNVEVKKNGVHYDTLTGAYLTPRASGAGWFYTDTATVGGTAGVTIVRAVDLANNETFDYMTTDVAVCYATSNYVSGGTVRQQINAVTSTSYGEKSYGTPEIVSGSARDYTVLITSPSYTSSANPCPAGGGSVTLVTSATHTVTQRTPWTRSYTKTYTSGSTSSGTESNYDDSPVTVQDTPTITGSADGFSRSGNNVTIANRGTTTGAIRSVTYTATNNSATNSVTLYQQKNEATAHSDAVRSIAIDYSGTLPNTYGVYTVNYSFYNTVYTAYTSGEETEHQNTAVTANVISTACTPSVNSVESATSSSFTIEVGVNTEGARNIVIGLENPSDPSGDYVRDSSKWQAGGASSVSAELYPTVGQRSGMISLVLKIAQADLSKVTWPVSVNNVTMGITVTGQSEISIAAYPQPVSFPQPSSPTSRESTVELHRIVSRPQGESGTIRVIKTSNAPTSDQVTNFTCDSKSYSVLGGL